MYNMKIIDCKQIRQDMLTEAKVELTKIYAYTGQKLKLVVIQVEGDAASDVYIRNKIKTCEECGIDCEHVKLPSDSTFDVVRKTIIRHTCNGNVFGLMLQLPLPDHLKPHQQELLDTIPWYMDVDGLSTESVGRLWTGQECITPATAQGIMRLLPEDLTCTNVCIVGRSNLVGKPLVKLLEQRNATVTLCHSKSGHLEHYTTLADIVITAIGKPEYFNEMYFADYYPQTWIDVGINRDENGKLCGDIYVDSIKDSYVYEIDVTPVPGGVGLLTTAQLVLNVVKSYRIQEKLFGEDYVKIM